MRWGVLLFAYQGGAVELMWGRRARGVRSGDMGRKEWHIGKAWRVERRDQLTSVLCSSCSSVRPNGGLQLYSSSERGKAMRSFVRSRQPDSLALQSLVCFEHPLPTALIIPHDRALVAIQPEAGVLYFTVAAHECAICATEDSRDGIADFQRPVSHELTTLAFRYK